MTPCVCVGFIKLISAFLSLHRVDHHIFAYNASVHIVYLLKDVRESVRIKTLERIIEMGAHSKAAGTPMYTLPLTRILGRELCQQTLMTQHEKFVNDVATLQLRQMIRDAKGVAASM